MIYKIFNFNLEMDPTILFILKKKILGNRICKYNLTYHIPNYFLFKLNFATNKYINSYENI